MATRIIAIESSDRAGSVAALEAEDGVTVVDSRELSDRQRSAQSLVPALQALLRDCQWRPGDIQLVCVTSGPGSFTGLRIGVTAAKTYAYAVGAELGKSIR